MSYTNFVGVIPVGSFGPVGTADDQATVQKAINTLSGTGAILDLGIVPLTFKTPAVIPPGAAMRIRGNPAGHIIGNLTAHAAATDAIFLSVATLGATSALSNPPVRTTPGTLTVSLVGNLGGALISGARFALSDNTTLRAEIFTVVSVAGAGPFIVTVDRPIRDAYATATTIAILVIAQPQDIDLDFNGMRISGQVGRYVEIDTGIRCKIRGAVCDGTLAGPGVSYLFSFDVGGQDNEFRDMWVKIGPNGSAALAHESATGGRIVDCVASSGASAGYILTNGYDCVIDRSDTFEVAVGALLTGDGTNLGPEDVRITNCSFIGSGLASVGIANATNTFIEACVMRYASLGAGVRLDNSLNTSTGDIEGVFITGCDLSDNDIGVLTAIAGGGKISGLHITQVDLSRNVFGMQAVCDYELRGFTALDNAAYVVEELAPGLTGMISDGNVRSSFPGGGISFFCAAGTAQIRNVVIEYTTSGALALAIDAIGGTVYVDGLIMRGAAVAGAFGVAPGTVATSAWIGTTCDFSTSTPIYPGQPGWVNRGTWVSTAAAPVTVHFPAIAALSRVNIMRIIDSSSVGVMPTIVIVPGTGFTASSFGGDLSTYAYEVL